MPLHSSQQGGLRVFIASRHCWPSALLLGATCLMASGCEFSSSPRVDYSSLGLCSVTGKVTLDGQPIEGVTITMSPPDSFTGSFGRTDTNGFYRMMYNSEQAGVTEGEKVVRLSTANVGAEEAPRAEKVPARYNRDSKLTARIPPGGALELNYDLESGGAIEKSPSIKDEDR
ncbi:MAG: hypothetical protein C0478_06085 [Planctomyces sp.]|nr:hypothetical protein [Planctomyces sp.]